MIRLDYYRLLPEIQYIGVVNEPDSDCHFSPYSVFILETRLYPLIYSLFQENIEITLKSEYNKDKNRMDVYLTLNKLENTTDPFIVNKLLDISDEQRKIIQDRIYEINSKYIDYALIDVQELYNTTSKIIPFSYFSQMLQYTGIDSSYNPFIRPEGIYLSFNPVSDYKIAYFEVCKFLVSRIEEFYEKGAVYLGNLVGSISKENMIKNWKLIPIDKEEIVHTVYEADWNYERFERFSKNKVDFLTRKLEGDPFIRLCISDNLVKRHGIATILQRNKIPMIIEGSFLKAEARNIDEAILISDLVDSVDLNGRVLVIASNRLSEIYLYFEYAKKKYGENNVTYSVSNNENPYIFSCLLPSSNLYSDLDTLRLEFRDYVTNRLIEVSKISKFKNMSPHEIIEKEYS